MITLIKEMKKREIKFRAWDGKTVSDVDCIDYGDKTIHNIGKIHGIKIKGYWFRLGNEDGWGNLNKVELMQFTGLKDKNGKEIYEGDILCPQTQESDATNRVVIKNDKRNNVNNSFNNFLAFGTHRQFEQDFLPDYYIIIGNIYENPELLNTL